MDELELCATHQHREDLIESITDAFFALDTDWRFTYVNARAEEIMQRSRGDLIGQNV